MSRVSRLRDDVAIDGRTPSQLAAEPKPPRAAIGASLWASSAAVCGAFAGFFASSAMISASASGDSPARARDGGSGGTNRCAPISSPAPSPTNGGRPATSS